MVLGAWIIHSGFDIFLKCIYFNFKLGVAKLLQLICCCLEVLRKTERMSRGVSDLEVGAIRGRF